MAERNFTIIKNANKIILFIDLFPEKNRKLYLTANPITYREVTELYAVDGQPCLSLTKKDCINLIEQLQRVI